MSDQPRPAPRRIGCPYVCGWSGAPSRYDAHKAECRGRRLALEVGDAAAARIQHPSAGRMIARRLTAVGLAGVAVLGLAAPAGAEQAQPGEVLRCVAPDGQIVGADTPQGQAPGVVCTPQRVVECWVAQPGEVVGGRQRPDGTWEARVYAGEQDANVQGIAGCTQVLPGVWVADADVPAVRAYLAHRATTDGSPEGPAEDDPAFDCTRDGNGFCGDPRFAPALDWPFWAKVAECESGGQNLPQHTVRVRVNGRRITLRLSGFLQVDAATWRRNGGPEFGSIAAEASWAEQVAVARTIAEREGGSHSWGTCWRRAGGR